MINERREKIRFLFSEKPFVSLEELKKMFPNVSEMTLRRDIWYCESIGVAIKSKGGAKSLKFITENAEDSITRRMYTQIEEKTRIARQAAKYLEPGRSFFMDAGSTVERVARIVPEERMIFTTTSPATALTLCKPGIHVVNMAGGRIDRDNLSISGMYAIEYLKGLNIDVAFLSPSGLSPNGEFTCGSYGDCELKRLVIDKARKVIMLMDHSKVDKTLLYTFCNLSDVDVLLTDMPLPTQLKEAAEKANCEVICCY